MNLDGVRRVAVTMGLPVTFVIGDDGFLRVTVDTTDVAGELARDVADGSADVQVLLVGQDIWQDADEATVDGVAEYLGEHMGTPWVDMDDAPGWDTYDPQA